MNRYWDLSEKERAALTSEQVDAMLAVELMEKGVVRQPRPVLLPVEVDAPPTTRMFYVKSGSSYGSPTVAYRTIADAEQAMSGAVAIRSEYVANDIVPCVDDKVDLSVQSIEVTTRTEVAARKAANEKAAVNKKANENATQEYEKSVKAVSAATADIWADWNECQAKQSRYQRIVDTFAEYVTISGDAQIALAFLVKAYSQDTVDAANAWLSFLPTVEVESEELATV